MKHTFFGWVCKQKPSCIGTRGGYFLRSGDKQHGSVITTDEMFESMEGREVVVTIDDGGDV